MKYVERVSKIKSPLTAAPSLSSVLQAPAVSRNGSAVLHSVPAVPVRLTA